MKRLKHICILSVLSITFAQAQSPEVILQREQIRRQEITLQSKMKLDEANKLISAGETDKATELLKEITQNIPETGDGAPIHDRATTMLADIELKKAVDFANEGKWFDSKDAAKRALELSPGNKNATLMIRQADEKLGVDANGVINPAVDRKFVSDFNEVKQLYKNAIDYEKTGQYDQSAAELKRMLKIDPFNKLAASTLKRINQKRMQISEKERRLIREQMLTDTGENWTDLLDIELEQLNATQSIVPIQRSNEFAIQEKLRNTILPRVEIVDGTINDAVQLLTTQTRDLDPAGTGVSFLVKNENVVAQSKPFTLLLENIPVDEALRYITNLAGVKFKVEEFAVFIVPLSDTDDVLLTREFPVRATFFDVEADGGNDSGGNRFSRRRTTVNTSAAGEDTIKSALGVRGVQFSEGASAIYNQATGILTVRNTQDQIDLIEELVTEDQGETLLVRIETKFIEVNQTDLDELTPIINLQGSYTAAPGTGTRLSAASISLNSGLNGSTNLTTFDGINRVINVDPSVGSAANPVNIAPTPSNVGITGAVDGNQFAALINLISQKGSADVMTAPSVIVNDGAQASINVSREFSFPIEFDPPDVSSTLTTFLTLGGFIVPGVVNQTSTSTERSRVTVVPSFPTEFEEKNVGVSMTVKPQITVDRQRVYLTMNPELVEFDGFVNYGSQIFDPTGSTATPQLLSDNEVRLPVFSTRTVSNAQLEIKDGYTMVLGGLIREDVSTVDEKVPFWGDLPLLGRAFRSKAEQSIKRNLLIFVSVRILRPDGNPYNQAAGVGSVAAAGNQ